MSVAELLQHINDEDALVAEAVRKALPQIEALVEAIEPRMKRGGRLFYVGAGTSGRLGVLDASELPPTFGVPDTWVIGIIAGGERALRHAVEKAEDITEKGWEDVQVYHPTADDTVIGIAASGTTPYVVGAVVGEWYCIKTALGQDLCTAVLGGQPELSLDTLEAAHRSNRDAVDYEIIRCLVRQVGKQLLSIGYNRDVFVRPAKSRADSYCGEGGYPLRLCSRNDGEGH